MYKKIISFTMVILMLCGIMPKISYQKAYAKTNNNTGIFQGKYGKDQVYDAFRNPTWPQQGVPVTTYNMSAPWDSVNRTRINWGPNEDRYLQLSDDATIKSESFRDAHTVQINLYEADGTFVRTIAYYATILGLGNDAFFAEGQDYFGYIFSNGKALSVTDNKSYNLTAALITEKNKNLLDTYNASTDVKSLVDVKQPLKISLSENKYTKDPVTVSVLPGTFTPTSYSFDGEAESSQNTKQYTKNGEYSVMATDGVYKYYRSFTIDNIDNENPRVGYVKRTPFWSTSGDVTLIVSGEDSCSGIAPTNGYSFDGGLTWQDSNRKTYSENHPNNDIAIKVKDLVGNISDVSNQFIINIDRTAPVITSIINNDKNEFSKEPVTVTIKCDPLVDKDIECYSFDGGLTWLSKTTVDGETWIPTNSKIFTENNLNIQCMVKDRAGNISKPVLAKVVNIDTKGPIISGISKNTENWTNGNVTLTINATDDLSGLADVPYSFDDGTTWQASNQNQYTSNTSEIKIAVKDKLNNITKKTTSINNIDKGQPTLKLTNLSDDWVSTKAVINVETSNSLSGIKSISYSTSEAIPQKGNAVVNNGTAKIELKNAGQYDVNVTATDNVGNQVSSSTNVKVDNTKPELILTPSSTDWTSGVVNVKIEAVDKLSGIKEVSYTTDEATPVTGIIALTNGVGNITLSNEGEYNIKVKAIDMLNNVEIAETSIKIDNSTPTIKLTPSTTNWTNGTVTVKVEVQSKFAGVKEVRYTTNSKTRDAGTIVPIVNGVGTIVLDTEGQYDLKVDAIGKTNAKVSAITTIKIDETNPTIAGANPAASYYVGRAININDSLAGILEATYIDKNDSSNKGIFKSGDVFNKPGNYTISLKDNAGNISELYFEIKPLPTLDTIKYTPETKDLLLAIKKELEENKDLPEAYKTEQLNKLKALEEKYVDLEKVNDLETKAKDKAEVVVQKTATDAKIPYTGGVVNPNIYVIIGLVLTLSGVTLIKRRKRI